jgi:hypothetical protein
MGDITGGFMKEGFKKVKIVDNLMDVIDDFFEGKEGHRTDEKFIELANRIQGKEVEIYFVAGDAFEVIDHNYWIPERCFTELS